MEDKLKNIFDYIDRNFERMLSELVEFCNYRSVSGDVEGLKHSRDFVQEKLSALELNPIRHTTTKDNALLYAHKRAEQQETLLFYNHLDVVHEGPLDEWRHPPFEPLRQGQRLYGRGVSDNKGGLMARLHALEAIKAVTGNFPVGIKFLIDDEEESGSYGLKELSDKSPELLEELLDADLCIWENGLHTADGQPQANFGIRTTCQIDLSVTTSNSDEHARCGAEIPNAAWRLCWALASIKDMEEKILIEGFYDDVDKITPEDMEVLQNYEFDEQNYLKRKSLDKFLNGLTGMDLKKKIFMEPSVTICAVESGEPSNGIRNVVPHKAFARLLFLMVPSQNAEDIFEKLRRHLDQNGFSDVVISSDCDGAPIRTPINSKYTGVLKRAAERVYDKPLILSITQLGSGPAYMLRKHNPELPIICSCGVSSTESGHHSPFENIYLQNYLNGIKHTVATLYEMKNKTGVN